MRYSWDEAKRARNLKQHGLDSADAPLVFAGLTFTFEDDRFAYREERLVTLGLLRGQPVSIIHTETAHEIVIISFRKATRREQELYVDATS
jgi:uncharacterized DUF497 family protein